MDIWKSQHRHLGTSIGIGIAFFSFFVKKLEHLCGFLRLVNRCHYQLAKIVFLYDFLFIHPEKGCLDFRNHTPISFLKI